MLPEIPPPNSNRIPDGTIRVAATDTFAQQARLSTSTVTNGSSGQNCGGVRSWMARHPGYPKAREHDALEEVNTLGKSHKARESC